MLTGLVLAGAAISLAPRAVGAWTRAAEPRVVSPADVFTYMDGAGELYLAYGLVRLEVYEYTSPTEPPITAEIYALRSSDDAYGLLSLERRTRVTLKVQLAEENPRVPSVIGVWPTADWLERETYDFYGIEFTGHPNLTRILVPEGWVGWPLRKDSPLGYEEVAFTHNTPDRVKPSPELKKLAPKKVRYRAR